MKRRLAEIAIVVGLGLFILGASDYGLHRVGRDGTATTYTGWSESARIQMMLGLMVLAGGTLKRNAH